MAKLVVKLKNPVYDIKLECKYHSEEMMDIFRNTLGTDEHVMERCLMIAACHEMIMEASKSYGSFNRAVDLMKETGHVFPDEDKETEVTYDIDF